MLEIIDKSYDEEIPDTKTYDTLQSVMLYFVRVTKILITLFITLYCIFLKTAGMTFLTQKNVDNLAFSAKKIQIY